MKSTLLTVAAITMLGMASPSIGLAGGHHVWHEGGGLTIYFTRHLQKQTVTIPVSEARNEHGQLLDATSAPYGYSTNEDGGVYVATDTSGVSKSSRLDSVCGEKKCAEELNPEGQSNALLLASWFSRHGITRKLDAVYATHKLRTQQTVQAIADDAGLGVTQVPASGTELNPESAAPSECATLDAIAGALDAGMDTILVAGHSGTLYDIMGNGTDCGGLGLDTTDAGRFPKDDDGKVRDYGDIWKIALDRHGDVRFMYRQNLQPSRLKAVDWAN